MHIKEVPFWKCDANETQSTYDYYYNALQMHNDGGSHVLMRSFSIYQRTIVKRPRQDDVSKPIASLFRSCIIMTTV